MATGPHSGPIRLPTMRSDELLQAVLADVTFHLGSVAENRPVAADEFNTMEFLGFEVVGCNLALADIADHRMGFLYCLLYLFVSDHFGSGIIRCTRSRCTGIIEMHASFARSSDPRSHGPPWERINSKVGGAPSGTEFPRDLRLKANLQRRFSAPLGLDLTREIRPTLPQVW